MQLCRNSIDWVKKDGKALTAVYHKFAPQAFLPTPGKFEIQLANNHFTQSQMQLDLPNVKGQLHFEQQVPWPNSWYSPGIMGPFSFVGFMDGRIEESMTSQIEVQLFDKKSQKMLLQDIGRNAGLEVAGNIAEIMAG